FSLGTNVFSNRISEEKINAFISAFSELPQKIIWKWESDILPGQPENVHIGRWFPQRGILAHPNIRLFISQCGLQSFQEAVFHAVPVLGIPFIVDQNFNAKKIQDSGIGVKLSFVDVTKESLTQSINEILHNVRYKENMDKFSALSKDESRSSLEKIVWWTEYVLRHNGTKHLRSAALDLTWYQYLLLDVMSFVIFIVLIIISILYYCIRLIYIQFLKKQVKTKYE
ncbi:UDP-glucuronosyltransferase 2B18, partial [Blattella germanica]